jgi:hypothetical protein
MAHTSNLRVDYHPFSTVTWCLLQKGYHCICLTASDTGRIQIVGSIYYNIFLSSYLYDTYIKAVCIKTYQPSFRRDIIFHNCITLVFIYIFIHIKKEEKE